MTIRKPMMTSKLTMKAIFKAKRPKIQLRENNQNTVVLTKFQNLVVLTKF